MRISLSSPVRKIAFLTGCTVFLVLFSTLTLQSFAEYLLSRGHTPEGVTVASRIQPLNAYCPFLLGKAFTEVDFAKATVLLEKSSRINPNSSSTWLALADAYGVTGETHKQKEAIDRALAVDPKGVDVEWDASLYLFQSGDIDGGIKLIRDAMTNAPGKITHGMQTAYLATGRDVPRTLTAIPPTAEARIQFVRWLVEQGNSSAADQAWQGVLDSNGGIEAKELFFYIDSLIARQQIEKAGSVWNFVATRDPQIQKRLQPGNLAINGDFESKLLNGGFDWRYTPSSDTSASIDTSSFHGGTRSLLLQFDASHSPDLGVFELVPVEPGKHYSIHAFMRSEELQSANGMRLGVTDYYSGAVLANSEEVLGTTGWRDLSTSFTCGLGTRLVKIGVVRVPPVGLFEGKLWVDDVRVERYP